GTSLHKWLTAPIGTGFLYMRKSKIAKVWPMMAAPPEMNDSIRKFEEIGTHPAANHNAIVEALDFLDGIGPERKAARLRFLRDRWARRLEKVPGVKILTPFDAAQSCGLASFTPGTLDVGKVTAYLFDRHRIIATPIAHPEFHCVRITPNVYTTLRSGPPEPPPIFIGSAITYAPVTGTLSRLATFSNAGMFDANSRRCTTYVADWP